jgi:hypothetical protein
MGRINYRNVKKIAYYILGIGIILTVLTILTIGRDQLFITLAVLGVFTLAYIGFVFWYYRCPWCGVMFPVHRATPEDCPWCGEELSSDD